MEFDIIIAPLLILTAIAALFFYWRLSCRVKPEQRFSLRRQQADGEWRNICEFRVQSPEFAYGFECGMFYERMQRVYEIHGEFNRANKEQLLDIVAAEKWTIHHISNTSDTHFCLHITDDVTPKPDIMPFLPPNDEFDPPHDWNPDEDEQGEFE